MNIVDIGTPFQVANNIVASVFVFMINKRQVFRIRYKRFSDQPVNTVI